MVKFVLLDLDDTILDFHKAEAIALRGTLQELGLQSTDKIVARYSEINSRQKSAGISRYFGEIFISQRIGHDKPAREFFDACFARIPGFQRDKAVIIGDSLTSDIQGGKNAGVRTVWYNYRHKPADADIVPDYETDSLFGIPPLLERL